MSTYRKTFNLVNDSRGAYAIVIRGGQARRYKHLTPASLARCRCLVRKQLLKVA